LNIPLFPLNTVLFPQGLLPLRVYEVRYTDMVRDCLRTGTPFGVVNISRGSDVQTSPEHFLTGTLANIVDFDMHEPAVLMIAALGGQRFKVQSTNAQASGLIRAQIELIDADEACAIPDEHSKCAKLLEQIIGELENQYAKVEKAGQKPFSFPVAKPYQFNDAGWVANRFAELMPLPRNDKQMLLEQTQPAQRLAWIHDFLAAKDVI
jgi:Lon protease-like protein